MTLREGIIAGASNVRSGPEADRLLKIIETMRNDIIPTLLNLVQMPSITDDENEVIDDPITATKAIGPILFDVLVGGADAGGR